MFEATLENAEMLKIIVDSTKDLVEFVNFKISKDKGIEFGSLDSSHVAMILLSIPPSAFAKFRCDEPLNLGIRMPRFDKVLDMADKKDSVSMALGEYEREDEKKVPTLELTFRGKLRVTNFSLLLLDISDSKVIIPDDSVFSHAITIPSFVFKKVITDINQIPDVGIKISEKGIEFSASMQEGRTRVEVMPTSSAAGEFQAKGAVSEIFSMRYMLLFIKAVNLSRYVKISLAKDQPILIDFSVPEGPSLKFFFAPKIAPKIEE